MKSMSYAYWAAGVVLTFVCAFSAGDTIVNGTVQILPAAPVAPPAGALIWLDATQTSSFTMNGANVAAWADRTGNGQQIAQGNAARQPTLNPAGINGLQTVDFSVAGTADQLYNTTNYASPVSVFTVQQLTGGANYRLVTSYTNNWLHGTHGGKMDSAHYDGWVNNSPYSADTEPHMYNAVIRGGTSNSDVYAFDSRNLSSVRLVAANGGGRNGPNGLALGGWSSTVGEASNGRVGEILIYSGALADPQRQQVERYLAAKWFNYNDAIPDDSAVIVNSGATLDLTTCVETIGSLSGPGNVVQTAGALNIAGAQAGTFTGNYTGGSAGLSKLGAASQSMTGAVSYSGATNVLQGDLTLGSSSTIGSTNSHFNVGTVNAQSASLTVGGGTIQAGPVVIGDYGTGVVNLTNTNLTANYNNYYGTLVLGLRGNGNGTITQNGGTVTYNNGYMILGRYDNSQGAYSISAGTLTSGGSGDHTMYLGWDSAGASGTLNVSGTANVLINGGKLEMAGQGAATVNQTGGTVTIRDSHVIIGRSGANTATYNISSGVFKTDGTGNSNRRMHMAWDTTGSKGYLNLSGDAQVIVNADNVSTGGATGFHVADRGTAEINIRDNASLTINGVGDGEGGFSIGRHGTAVGTVNQYGGTVTVNDNYLILGRWDSSQGTYNISGGVLKTAGTINSNRRMHLGWDSASDKGTMNISGNAQVITNADNSNPNNNGVGMMVGYNGTGTLTLADNAQLTINAAGDPDGGLVVAWNGGNSSFTQTGGTATLNDNYLMLGRTNAAQGTMTVTGGTFAQGGTTGNRNTYLGWNHASARGVLNVGGTGVVNLGADLNIAYQGTGNVTVSGNGRLNVPGVIEMAAQNGSVATLALNGGVLTTGGLNKGGGAATVSFDGGTLRAGRDFATGVPMTLGAGGGTIDTDGHRVDSIGVLSGAGGLTKAGDGTLRLGGIHSYAGDTVVTGGTLQLIPTPHQAYQIASQATNGGQSHPGSLGYDFRVNPGQSVLVTHLGFYDSQDNIGLAASHDMFITNTTNTATYVSSAIAAGTSSPLLSGYRFAELASPVALGPGTYRIWGYNYGLGDKDFNNGGLEPGPKDGGNSGAISFGDGVNNRGYWQSGNVFPNNIDGGVVYRYGAVSFLFLDSSPDTALPAGTNVRVASGGTLDLFGLNQTIASVGDQGGSGGSVLLGGATLTLGGADSATFSGSVGGPGSIVKSGTGSQFFNGAIGNSSAPISLAVNDGLVGGTGPFSGPITIGDNGTISAGNSPGHLVVSGSAAPVDYTQTGTLLAEIGGPNQGLDYDWIEVFGAASVTGTIDIDRFNNYIGFGPFYVLTATEGIEAFDLTLDGSDASYGHYDWRWSVVDWGQGGQALQLELVPEPMTLLALGLGLTGLGGYFRRRRGQRA